MEKDRRSALSSHATKCLKDIKTADILVGIPSLNSAHTINYVVYQVVKGLDAYFPDFRSVIFVSDGKSTDGTLATVKAMHLTSRVSVVPATYLGPSGKGSAVRAIFNAAESLEAKAVALVDSDLRSITPEWVKLLISPVLAETGLVTPFYVRHKYDGTITNFLCYPVTSSLYGKEVRQPIGGDFGISIKLVRELLGSELWLYPSISGFGIDIFVTHTALAEGFDVKQAFLGIKVHEAKDPSKHLASMFRQVVGSMFVCIGHYERAWRGIQGVSRVEIINRKESVGEPEPVRVNLQNAIKTCRNGLKEYKQIYRSVLSSDMLRDMERLQKMDDTVFSFPSENWAKIVYLFLAGFRRGEESKGKEMLDALRVLWIGRVASFVKETSGMDTRKVEEKVDEEIKNFRELKTYLLDIF